MKQFKLPINLGKKEESDESEPAKPRKSPTKAEMMDKLSDMGGFITKINERMRISSDRTETLIAELRKQNEDLMASITQLQSRLDTVSSVQARIELHTAFLESRVDRLIEERTHVIFIQEENPKPNDEVPMESPEEDKSESSQDEPVLEEKPADTSSDSYIEASENEKDPIVTNPSSKDDDDGTPVEAWTDEESEPKTEPELESKSESEEKDDVPPLYDIDGTDYDEDDIDVNKCSRCKKDIDYTLQMPSFVVNGKVMCPKCAEEVLGDLDPPDDPFLEDEEGTSRTVKTTKSTSRRGNRRV